MKVKSLYVQCVLNSNEEQLTSSSVQEKAKRHFRDWSFVFFCRRCLVTR